MLQVLFFARVREELDCASLEFPCPDSGIDLHTLVEQICLDRPTRWREVLSQDNLICAVNQTITSDNIDLRDGDEVAFFPPVTGG